MFCCDSRVDDEEDHGSKRRTCSDVFCLSFFSFFWIFLLVITGISFYVGDPMRLIKGTDSFGNVCGRKNDRREGWTYSGIDLTDRPYVFFLDAQNITNSLSICVKKCPDRLLNNNGDVLLFYQETDSLLCRYDYQVATTPAPQYLDPIRQDSGNGNGPCPNFPVYKSRVVLNRCIPENIYSLGKGVVNSAYNYLKSFDPFRQTISDLAVSMHEIIIMTGFSLVVTFIVVFLIHFMAKAVAWIFLVVVSIVMIVLSGIFWWTYFDLKYNLGLIGERYSQLLDEKYRNERTFLVLSISVTVVTVILVLICLVMRKRVQLVVALFNEAAACIRAMPGLLIQPVWTFIVLLVTTVFFFALFLAIATADHAMTQNKPLAHNARRPSQSGNLSEFGQPDLNALTQVNFADPSWVRYMWWYAIIGYLWTTEFILGCQQMVIAGAVSSWYFNRDRSNLPCPVGRSIRRLICYHMGTVIFGAFLITLLKIPRMIIGYITEKLKQNEEYAVVRGCLYCCSCFMWLLENFLKYVNRNAYTVTAIKGTPFCKSASIAFNTIASNALRVATINSVGDFILFLGKVIVTASTAIGMTLLLKVRHKDSILEHSSLTLNIDLQNNDSINFYAVPVIASSLIAFFIAHCILSVYEVSISLLTFPVSFHTHSTNIYLPNRW